MNEKVAAVITDRFIEALEAGTVPWKCGWLQTGPRNLKSKKPYRGCNVFLLNAIAQVRQYDSNYWLTYNQAKERGGEVRAGEKGAPVIFWKWLTKEEDGKKGKTFPMLRYYTVFNINQVDGVEAPPLPEGLGADPIESAERIIREAMAAGRIPAIEYSGDKAAYSPDLDRLILPPRETFFGSVALYSTAFHEMVHATGHETRLGRPIRNPFGSPAYAKEELIAEMGSAMLASVAGIDTAASFDNSAAYVANWLQALKNDKTLVVAAGGAAQKAVDYLQGIKFDNEDGG